MEAKVQYLDEKLSQLSHYVDSRTAELLANRFVNAFAKAATGLVGIINNLYFLEYGQVKELLKAFAEITGDPLLTKQEWDKIRREHMLKTLREYYSTIQSAKIDIQDIYDEAKQDIQVLETAVRLAEAALILHYASGGFLVQTIWFAAVKVGKFSLQVVGTKAKYVGPGLAAAGIAAFAIDEKFRDFMKDVLNDY